MDKQIQLYLGNCKEVLKKIEDNSIDLIVTDPPYGYSFMGKDWDEVVIPSSTWKECLRVLKPGAFAFIMSAPRQDVLGRMIHNLQEAGFETGFTSIYWTYACLSEDTKILTENGLKGMNEISDKDIVYSLDTKTNLLVKSKVKKVFIYPFKGKLFNLKNQNTDQLLTLNHKILYKNQYHSGNKKRWDKEWHYKEANELILHSAIKIPISAKYKGSKRIGKDLASLLGWILTDGGFDKCNRSKAIRIYQSSTNQFYVNEIRNLLNKLKIPYKEYNRIRKYKDRNYTEFCFFISGKWAKKIKKLIPNKQPTQYLLELIYNERLELYNSLIKGDGSKKIHKERNYPSTDCFYQNNEHFLNWFERLVLSLGWQIGRDRNKQVVNVKKQSDTEFQWINYHPKLVDYKGKVWCIETETSNFIAWRNERYFITGNSGFPKAINISKAIDKRKGLKGKEISKAKGHTGERVNNHLGIHDDDNYEWKGEYSITEPESEEAKKLKGSFGGFQPKPAVEIIIVCMKSLSEKGYIDQALKNSKGITNLDDCRIPYFSDNDKSQATPQGKCTSKDVHTGAEPDAGNNEERIEFERPDQKGRFPANLLVSDDVLNDGKISKSIGGSNYKNAKTSNEFLEKNTRNKSKINRNLGDSGSFSRYFDLDAWTKENNIKEEDNTFPFLICPKASKSEKNKGCENLEEKIDKGSIGLHSVGLSPTKDNLRQNKNFHPTVKPIKLMSYLITLGSRKEDIILDPFMGSGTTGVACKLLNRKFIGIELSEDYLKIAQERIKNTIIKND